MRELIGFILVMSSFSTLFTALLSEDVKEFLKINFIIISFIVMLSVGSYLLVGE